MKRVSRFCGGSFGGSWKASLVGAASFFGSSQDFVNFRLTVNPKIIQNATG